MRRVRRIVLLLGPLFLAANCKDNQENKFVCQIYFGDKYTAKMYCDDLSGPSPYTYVKIFSKESVVYTFEKDNFYFIGIDSLKKDTLFLYRKVFSPSHMETTQYKTIDSGHIIVRYRDIKLYGSSIGESDPLIFVKRINNQLYFKSDHKVVDSINLRDMFFSGEAVSTIKYLDESGKKIIYFEHMNFVDSQNKIDFLKSFE